eukprot:4565528-Prymnesium_polylepis.1
MTAARSTDKRHRVLCGCHVCVGVIGAPGLEQGASLTSVGHVDCARKKAEEGTGSEEQRQLCGERAQLWDRATMRGVAGKRDLRQSWREMVVSTPRARELRRRGRGKLRSER